LTLRNAAGNAIRFRNLDGDVRQPDEIPEREQSPGGNGVAAPAGEDARGQKPAAQS
jgi:hypothetical protein